MDEFKKYFSSEDWLQRASETIESFRIVDFELTQDEFYNLIALKAYTIDNELGNLIVRPDIGDEIDLDTPYSEEYSGKVSFKIEKADKLYFITEHGFLEFLNSSNTFPKNHIYLQFTDSSFTTFTLKFLSLTKTENFILGISEEINSVKYIKALNPAAQNLLPKNLQDWLTPNKFFHTCPSSWKTESAKKILCCLCTEFYTEDDSITYEFKGDLRKSLKILNSNNAFYIHVFENVNTIAQWIYFQKIDIESRLILFNQQFSTLLNNNDKFDSDDLNKKMAIALENSKLAFAYYLSNSSKELQKTLVDLNKTLFDYIGKMRQNTTDLSTSLWRDFATVLAVIILNFTIKKQDVIQDYFKYFGIGLCIYITISFFITSNSGFWFYYSLKESLKNWRTKLYSYLSSSEYSEFALIPLRNAFEKFRFVFWICLVSYLSMIVFVLFISDNLSWLSLNLHTVLYWIAKSFIIHLP